DLATLLPELHAMGGPGDDGGDKGAPAAPSGLDRARLFERFLGFLGRLGASAPALTVVEDVQWIDPATRDLVTFLVRNVTTEPLVALLTCRTDDLAPGHPVLAWMAEIGRAPGAVRVDLGRLSRTDVARQLEAIAEGPVAEDILDSIWRRSEGHPLFAEELLGTAASNGFGTPSLVEVLLGRVMTLAPGTLRVVETLAVAGRPVDERLIGRLVDRTDVEAGAAADKPAESYRAAVIAAGAADAVHAFGDAQRLLERAISLATALPADARPGVAELIDLHRRAAEAADLAGAFDAAIAHIRAALVLLDPSSEPAIAGSLHARLGYLMWARGDAEAALDEHREAVRLVPAEPPSIERARVLASLGGALMGLGRGAESRPVCEAAIECAVAAGAVAEESRARNMLGSDLVALG